MKKFAVLIAALSVLLLCLGLAGCPMDNSSSNPREEDSKTDPQDKTETVQEAITKGNDFLLADDYNKAVESYKDAYAKDTTNPEAIIYSVLAELAAISVDPKVKNLMQNRLGMKSYPATMGALFSDSWMKNYPTEEMVWGYWDDGVGRWVWWNDYGPNGAGYYYSDYNGYGYTSVWVSSTPKYEEYENHVPELQVPGWFEGTNVYLESKITGNVESYTTWTLLLAANLLEKNTNGLNGLFSDVIESGFGATFENLCARAGQLKDSDSAKLDGRIIEKLGLDEILEGDVIISKVELDVLLAGLRIIKASLEWLASYNWETDFSFLKYDWNNYDEFQNKLRTATDAQLPFKNNFLKNQDETLLNKSKADYLSAIDTLVGAYDAIGDKDYIPEAVKDEWNNYLWIKDGLGKLRAAINGGGAFYVPENMPSGNVWPNQKSGAVWGIDMGKFFEKNYLTLDKLVENGSGKPKFYTITGDPPLGTPLNSSPNSGDRAVIGFKMLLTPVKNLIPVGLEDLEESLYLPMPPEVGKILYDLYNN